jgi:hypothetical protein
MINCQPRQPVVLLISGFLCSAYLLAGIWMYSIFTSSPSLISLFIICLILSLLLFFTVRLAVGYKGLRADKSNIIVDYKLLGKRKTYPLASLTGVEEVKINTFRNKEYRQLILMFGQDKITINSQVYTGYDALKAFVSQRNKNHKHRSHRR